MGLSDDSLAAARQQAEVLARALPFLLNALKSQGYRVVHLRWADPVR